MSALAEKIARAFHERYEALAPRYGYKTRDESAVEWEVVPPENKALMVGVVSELLAEGVIAEGVPDSGHGFERELFPAESDLPQRFYDDGMVWLANRLLHPFGWAIGVMAADADGSGVSGLVLMRTADTDGIVTDTATEVNARRKFFAALRRGPTVRVQPEAPAAAPGVALCESCENPLTDGECHFPRCEKYVPVRR